MLAAAVHLGGTVRLDLFYIGLAIDGAPAQELQQSFDPDKSKQQALRTMGNWVGGNRAAVKQLVRTASKGAASKQEAA